MGSEKIKPAATVEERRRTLDQSETNATCTAASREDNLASSLFCLVFLLNVLRLPVLACPGSPRANLNSHHLYRYQKQKPEIRFLVLFVLFRRLCKLTDTFTTIGFRYLLRFTTLLPERITWCITCRYHLLRNRNDWRVPRNCFFWFLTSHH